MYDTLKCFSLEGKTAVVTGGTSGLGLAITRCMIGAGARVAVIGHSPRERVEEVLAEFGSNAVYYCFDITETEETPKIAAQIISDMGSVSILVNNAGNHCKKLIEDMSVEDYVSVLNVHLVGAFALTKAFFPHMKENGGGSIIFQASMTSYIGQPAVAGYATAKAGYLGLVHTLATEGGPYRIRVNAIAPGWIETPMFHKATDGDKPRLDKILGRIPMKEIGKPEDIGLAAVFLSGEAAKYISGSCLAVDGGALIGF